MTQPPAPPAELAKPQITPPPGSRLEWQLEQLEAAKTAKDEAEARVAEIGAEIKAESVKLAMAQYRLERPPVSVRITGSATRPAYDVRWVATSRVDSRRLRAEQPALYERYLTSGGHWETRKVQ